MTPDRPRFAFITGKLAEPALRRVLTELGPRVGFEPVVVVLPITVAALMTADWVARHLPSGLAADGLFLPGYCRGDAVDVAKAAGVPAVLGPKDLRDLPEFFGNTSGPPPDYGAYDIEILAEINHAPKLSLEVILVQAQHYRDSHAEIIDLGCDPGITWSGVGAAVRLLCERGFRVSIDSFNPEEVMHALEAGAELVLSVNSTNLQHVRAWHERFPAAEMVAIPDSPSDLDSLARTVAALTELGVKHRLDPILEPIGFGFAASLGAIRNAPALPGCGTDDGDRQPHRIDGCRFGRH